MSRAKRSADDLQRVVDEFVIPFVQQVGDKNCRFKSEDFIKHNGIVYQVISNDSASEALAHKKFVEIITNYVDEMAEALDQVSGVMGSYLASMADRWYKCQMIMSTISCLFMHLDNSYNMHTQSTRQNIQQAHIIFFKRVYLKHNAVLHKHVLDSIAADRQGSCLQSEETQACARLVRDMQRIPDLRTVNRPVRRMPKELQEQTKIKRELGLTDLYERNLEAPYLEQLGNYFRVSRATMLEESTADYLAKSSKLLAVELIINARYLSPDTADKVRELHYVCLLKEALAPLIEKKTGLKHMLETRSADIEMFYMLYKDHKDDLLVMAAMVKDFVVEQGEKILKEGVANDQMTNLIALHHSLAVMTRQHLGGNMVFKDALSKGFELLFEEPSLSGKLAQYVHSVLSRGSALVTGPDVLDNAADLYSYIADKDRYELQHKDYLAHRLVSNTVKDMHSELSMISKLKTRSGYAWANSMEGMLKDIEISKEYMEAYRLRADPSFDHSVVVCSSASWPRGNTDSCKLPPEMNEAFDSYFSIYLEKNQDKLLDLQLDAGRAELEVEFSPAVKRTLLCSTYQMIVMCLFRDAEVLTFKEMISKTGAKPAAIAHHVLSLAHPSVGVLLKLPNTRNLLETDKFKVNTKYNKPLLKVQIPLMEPVKDVKEPEQDVRLETQRRYELDSTIVRLMKVRKTMTFSDLRLQAALQLKPRFLASVSMVKKRVESLLDQEYLRRDDTRRDLFHYVA